MYSPGTENPYSIFFRLEFQFIWAKSTKDDFGQVFENYNSKIEIYVTLLEKGALIRASRPVLLKSQYLQNNFYFRGGYLGAYQGSLDECELYTKQSFYTK